MEKNFDMNTVEIVVERYSDMILRIAFQNLKHKANAEDVVQEVFIRLLKTKQTFNEEEHLKAWLIRVTINLCKNYWKTGWVRNTVPLAEEWIFIPEENMSLFEELWCLPQKYRNVLYLHYFEGYTAPEIAELLKIPLSTVYTHLQRAKKALKSVILEEESDD